MYTGCSTLVIVCVEPYINTGTRETSLTPPRVPRAKPAFGFLHSTPSRRLSPMEMGNCHLRVVFSQVWPPVLSKV